MRLPYAMRSMIVEISEVCEDALIETQMPDGYNVWRMLVLDIETSKVISPFIEVLMMDNRLHSIREADDRLHIMFVHDSRADDPKPFHLNHAIRIVEDNFSRD